MNKEDIKQFLPHREPMLLIDDAVVDENNIAHCKYTIKEDEFFTRGHFPDNPIVPGVIQCEIMAQCCAILVKDYKRTDYRPGRYCHTLQCTCGRDTGRIFRRVSGR